MIVLLVLLMCLLFVSRYLHFCFTSFHSVLIDNRIRIVYIAPVAQPVSNHRLTHPRVPAGLMNPPASEHLGRQLTSPRQPSPPSTSARLPPRDAARRRPAALCSTPSVAGASTANTPQVLSEESGRIPGRRAL